MGQWSTCRSLEYSPASTTSLGQVLSLPPPPGAPGKALSSCHLPPLQVGPVTMAEAGLHSTAALHPGRGLGIDTGRSSTLPRASGQGARSTVKKPMEDSHPFLLWGLVLISNSHPATPPLG